MTSEAETVILIHGLWMRRLVMLPYQRWMLANGFKTCRLSYPSWRDGLEENSQLLSRFINGVPGDVIHLVAHSLGGLVALKMMSQKPDARIRRIVVMGTPYAGSHCARTISRIPILAGILGHTMEDWLKEPRPSTPTGAEIGVVAGTRSISVGRLVPGLNRPNDGIVAVEETVIPTAKDSISLPVSHAEMLLSRTCANQIANFLKTGTFGHA